MEKLEDVSQSPLEIDLKGKKFKLGAIGFIDYGDFAQYIKSQKLALAEHIKDKDMQLKVIDKIMTDIVDIEKEYGTVNGICYMAWKSIQKYQPEITLKDINELIDMTNFEKVSIIMNNLGGKVENPTIEAKKKK